MDTKLNYTIYKLHHYSKDGDITRIFYFYFFRGREK